MVPTGSGNSQWLIDTAVTARSKPLTSDRITSSARSNSVAPAALIIVKPTTMNVATSELPPLMP
ncbi:hypothetical protein D3C77_727390 [compost metagenome]